MVSAIDLQALMIFLLVLVDCSHAAPIAAYSVS